MSVIAAEKGRVPDTLPLLIMGQAGDAPVACYLCGGKTFALWAQCGRYSVHSCTVCGLGVTHPFPSPEDFSGYEVDDTTIAWRINACLSRKEELLAIHREQVHRIQAKKRSGSVLDVGCNVGLFLVEAEKAGYQCLGVEPIREYAEVGIQQFGLDVRIAYLEALQLPSASFDVVTLYDVVEHVPDPCALLREVRRILKPDGLLVLQSPNLGSVMADFCRAKWPWLLPPDHLFHFTATTFAALAEKAGFVVSELRTWEPTEDFTNALIAAIVPDRFPGNAIRKILRLSRVIYFPVRFMQRFWWKKQRGALLELYASPVQ